MKSSGSKVNNELSDKLHQAEEDASAAKGKKRSKLKTAAGLLQDDRFASLFANKDFTVDPDVDKQMHPVELLFPIYLNT